MSALSPAAVVARIAVTPVGIRIITFTRLRQLARLVSAQDPDPTALLSSVLLLCRRARFFFDRGLTVQAISLLERGEELLAEACDRAGDDSAFARFGLKSLLRFQAAVYQVELGADAALESALTSLRGILGLADELWDSCVNGFDLHLSFEETEVRDALVALFDHILSILFHRSLHFGSRPSPYSGGTDSVDQFLAPLRDSSAWRAIAAPFSMKAPVRVASGNGRARRLLFVSLSNWNFISGIVEDYESDPAYEVRRLDLASGPEPIPTRESILRHRISLALGDCVPAPSDRVANLLSWADVIFVEWGQLSAAWASLVVPDVNPRARLVVRLHSFEASSEWPLLISWPDIDGLITVAPGIRLMLHASAPASAMVDQVTLPNRSFLTALVSEKQSDAPLSIALVGWASRRKDPMWALDLLDHLREADPRWRIILIGPDFDPQDDPVENAYAKVVHCRLAELGDAAEITGRTQRVAEYLKRVDVIISSSRREGTHEGFIEGVASGAFPVCRRWPEVAAWGGPGALFPREWIVDTPMMGAARILTTTPDERRRQGRTASEFIIRQRDWATVRGEFDSFMNGHPRNTDAEASLVQE